MSPNLELRKLFRAPLRKYPHRWYGTPLAVLLLGLVSVLVLAWTLWITDQRTGQALATARAVNDLQRAVAYWHLWLEEHLSGDKFIDLDRDVRGNQDLAMRLASTLLRGGMRTNGDVVKPLQTPELRARAEALESALTEFRNLSEDRIADPEAAGVGTPIDQAFDRKFHQVRKHAETLQKLDEAYLEQDRAQFRLRVQVTVTGWALIVAAAAAALWSRERRRQQAADTLRASQRWLATTLSSIGDAVVTTDLEGRIFFMNPMAEVLTGWPRKEAAGQPIDEVFVIAREDSEPIRNPVAEVLRTGARVDMTNQTVMIDRQRHHCYGIDEGAAPIRDGRGALLGAVLVFRDVGHRRQTEKTLRQREAELQQAQKMEAVGRLAGGIAHDVNNYLGAIRGYCEVAVLKGEHGEALERRMGAAIETADKISALIQQLLAFSRRQPVQPVMVDVNRVIADLELLMKRLLGEDIALLNHLSPDLWSVEIDLSQIEQILVNLLVNARDAMPTGGKIEIATTNAELTEESDGPSPAPAGRYIKLTVADTGCGIPPEVHKKIFDPFFTTKAESGSSGLGLATVFAIVQQYSGWITVDSQVGEGSRFEIYLPADDTAPAERPAATAAPMSHVGRARVLLVEDNEDMRDATRALLEALGHTVRVAPTGEEALDVLKQTTQPFDLLITDVILPGLSGRELFDRVRETRGDLPCLFISGYTDNIMLRHGGGEQGRTHFLQKPFSFDSLGRKIAEVLNDSGQA